MTFPRLKRIPLIVCLTGLLSAGTVFAEAPERNVFVAPSAEPAVDAVVPSKALPPPPPAIPVTLPPIPSVEGRVALPPVLPPAVPSNAETVESKPQPSKRVFMTQQELTAERSRCDIKAKVPSIAVSGQGGQVSLSYQVLGGRNCLGGAASEDTWADVARADEGQATVVLHPNNTGKARDTTVAVVTRNGRTAIFTIKQAANN